MGTYNCGFCKKSIHKNDLGGVKNGIGFFHENCWVENMKNQVCPECKKLDNEWCNSDFHGVRFPHENNK